MHIVTWNMQGANHSEENKWNAGVRNLMNNAGHICCLQECGAVPASAHLVNANFAGIMGLNYYTWGTERTAIHILFYPADPNGNRCNLAIVSERPPLNARMVYPAATPVWRPAIGIQVNPNFWVFTLHAISPNGPDAPGLLNAINGSVPPGASWAALGDYNREPVTLVTPYVVVPPNRNTFSVNNPVRAIDYCVKNYVPQNWGAVQLGLIMSDHYPVVFLL
jgi:cytolethal distending toxin subunit B